MPTCDRCLPAPTPNPAPGLDLDAVERDVDNIDEGNLSLKVGAAARNLVSAYHPHRDVTP